MPAFHDSHTHVIIGALMEKGGFLRDTKSEEEAARRLYDLHRDSQDEWVLGGAWDHYKWESRALPRKETLDRYFPDKPVLLVNRECHGAWVNSAALAYFGIDRNTPNPEFGEILKGPEGEPTGYLHETAYTKRLKQVLEKIPSAVMGEYAKAFFRKAHSLGITAVSDMQIAEIILYEVYDALEKKGELSCRVHYSVPLHFSAEKMQALAARHHSALLAFSGAKDFVDGTPMGYTGLMIEPYSDLPDSCGSPMIDLAWMKEQIIALDKVGIRSRLHACGDLAVRVALDAFEAAAQQNGKRGIRHTIEHIEVCDPADIPRFGALDVIAAVQPEHLPKYDYAHHPFHKILGEGRVRYSWPFKSIQDCGGLLGFGTDYPVSELSPFRGLYRAVTRMTNEQEPVNGFIPEERLPLSDSLRAYTYGSAFINEREKELGTLEPGKLADMVVLDRNLFRIPAEDLIRVNAAMTIMNGDVVFER